MSQNKYLNKKIKRNENIKDDEIEKKNIIIGNIEVLSNTLEQRIINSSKKNEEDIKGCEIYINDKKIDFTYYYKFPNEGNYKIKYVFTKLLNSTNSMFSNCNSLKSLDLSNFNTENIKDMHCMFYNCNSLRSLDLSNFNTQNVTNMFSLFFGCNSLISLNLTNFNTQNVYNMKTMFYNCYSLLSLDLSNFDTQNVINMESMFRNCFSLISLDLSNFNTKMSLACILCSLIVIH